jgi:hypothetical protein
MDESPSQNLKRPKHSDPTAAFDVEEMTLSNYKNRVIVIYALRLVCSECNDLIRYIVSVSTPECKAKS